MAGQAVCSGCTVGAGWMAAASGLTLMPPSGGHGMHAVGCTLQLVMTIGQNVGCPQAVMWGPPAQTVTG